MIILLYLISILTDLCIWKDIRKYSTIKGSRIYGVSAIVCWIFLTVAICLPRRDTDSGIGTIMWMLYAYLTIYIPKIVYTVFTLIGMIPKLFKHKRLNLGLWVGVPIGSLVFIMLWWGALVGRNEIEVKEVTIQSSRLPESFDGYRILQFSDVHTGTWGNDTTFISRLVENINNQHADLIVFTGDLVNRQTEELKPFKEILSRLKAKDGVISILGNHDYGDYITWDTPELKKENLELMIEMQKEMGWELLRNQNISIVNNTDTIMLIGVENWGEPPFKQYGKLHESYPNNSEKNLYDENFKILLTHNPEHWLQEVLDISNIDLSLSGHTHAMQFMIEIGDWKWSPAKYKYKTWGGLYKDAGKGGAPMQLYVNIGDGEVGLPFRIGATPELTVLTLKR